jgi:glycosyltransferase involved in cell wall biosynthesis
MRILFIDVGTNLKTVRDLENRARGGMVTSLFRVSDYLSRRHHVYVSSDIEVPGQTRAGTNWIHEPFGPFDVLVCNRGIGHGYPSIEAKARVLWTHDLPHSGFIPEPKSIRGFKCTVFMSRYAERIWRTFYQDIGKSVLIPNGVDKELFHPREKDFGYLIYASAPNRGLEKLPLIAESIDEVIDKDVYCRAFSNLALMHPGEGEDVFDYSEIRESIVDLKDPLPQKSFAEELGKAGLMILPSDYPEICSNSVLQALASGTPVITTGKMGATCEWVKHRKNGMLTQFLSHDYMVHSLEIARNAIEVLRNERLHRKLIRGASRTRVLSWDEVGRRWLKLIERIA